MTCGRIAARRTIPAGGAAVLEVTAGLAAARAARSDGVAYGAVAADEILLVGSFLRRPPPELAVVPLEPEPIVAACRTTRLRANVA